MTDKLRELLEDVQTVYEGKGMIVHPNSFDKLRIEVVKLDNVSRLQNDYIEKAKELIKRLKALYLSPVVTNDDVKRQDEVLNEVEQFLNSEVEKC